MLHIRTKIQELKGDNKFQHFEAASSALQDVTTTTIENHGLDPKDHLHKPADHESSHSWLKKHFPHTVL